MHGKKVSGNRKQRLGKRERQIRDSKQKIIRTLFLKALASRIASRSINQVLSKENIESTQKRVVATLENQLEEEIKSVMVLSNGKIMEENSGITEPESTEKEEMFQDPKLQE